MRKTLFFIVSSLLFTLLFPVYLSAEQKDETGNDEYNELGIRIGTEVYGEDISKLSEEELQYIPEGWRDGVVEDEHHEKLIQEELEEEPTVEMQPFSVLSRNVYPNVNNYIRNMSVPSVAYDYKSQFTKFNYRYGHGAVEGVVAHETANDRSTIHSEISYMERNHRNAFVHAFVDHNHIIEIHPLDYGAWGGGRYANQRFVHVELTRVHTFDHFARSINNYADYIANILYDYGLGVTSADNNGRGTLWSHRAVSVHLGGTNHVDPHGYFAKWGYNWSQFVSLVTQKHNQLVESRKANTSKLAHINSSNARVYQSPLNLTSYSTAGNTNLNEVFYIKAEAKIAGNTYYLLSRQPSNRNGVIGWVRASDVTANAHTGVDKKSKSLIFKGTGEAYDKAWGGSKNLVYNDLSAHAGNTFRVHLTEKVGNTTWYRGNLNGKTVWISSSHLSNIQESSTSKLGHLKNANVTVFKEIYDDSTSFTAGTERTNKVYYIKREAKANGDTFYLISEEPSSSRGVIGWVHARDLSTHNHTGVDKRAKTLTITGQGQAFTKAWGGSKDLVDNLANHAGSTFRVNLTEKVGNNTWYRGTLNGERAWIHSSYLIEKSNTSKLGHIRNADVTIYSDLYTNAPSFKAGTEYTNIAYYIKQQAKAKGQTYYLISTLPSRTSGVVGWVNARDLSTHNHSGVDKKSKTFYFKGTGKAYSKAWGGAQDLVHNSMSQFANQEFRVHLTEKVGSNTWYRGNFNGETIWLHSSYLTTKEESNTSRLGHLRADATIYKTIGVENSSFNADNHLNAVYYIKKQAKLNGQTYYLISTQPSRTNGVIGWVKSNDMSSHTHVGVDKARKSFTFKGTGKAYSKAWGGAEDLVFNSLSAYKGQQFNVHLTEKVGNNIWYRGDFNGERIWLHNSYVE
ncbi:GW dipeptide domain-containing protein [Oceanobacillus sp. CAU 1775]